MSIVNSLAHELGLEPVTLRKALRHQLLPRKCGVCQTTLLDHERPDKFCYACLKNHQTAPMDATLRAADQEEEAA